MTGFEPAKVLNKKCKCVVVYIDFFVFGASSPRRPWTIFEIGFALQTPIAWENFSTGRQNHAIIFLTPKCRQNAVKRYVCPAIALDTDAIVDKVKYKSSRMRDQRAPLAPLAIN